MPNYRSLGTNLGALVDERQRAYGNSTSKTGEILEILFPKGVPIHHYKNLHLIVRMIDKICRICERGPDNQDLGNESPFKDLAGYAMIGLAQDEEKTGSARAAVAINMEEAREVKR